IERVGWNSLSTISTEATAGGLLPPPIFDPVVSVMTPITGLTRPSHALSARVRNRNEGPAAFHILYTSPLAADPKIGPLATLPTDRRQTRVRTAHSSSSP